MRNLPEINWKKLATLPESTVPATLLAWLLHSGSFMQRLEQHGVVNAQVQVLSQSWQLALPWENEALDLSSTTEVLVREVLILSAEHRWMFARSIFPRDILTGQEAELAHLQTRPLGTILFNHPEMKRSEFSYACLHPGMLWHEKIMHCLCEPVDRQAYENLWARYSVFHLQKKSLLLTEVFLPDVATL